jgi:prepilin-type N-terminal cleavage/methylation domain-containing protein
MRMRPLPHPVPEFATPARRRPAGFTLVELVVSMVLLGVVVASVLSLILSQARFVSRVSSDIQALDQVRTAQETLSYEVSDLPRGAVVYARSDSLVYRLPIKWGLVCGPIDRNQVQAPVIDPKKGTVKVVAPTTIAAMQMEPDADDLGTTTADGFALSADGTTFSFYPVSNWTTTLGLTANDTAAAIACLNITAPTVAKAKKAPHTKKTAPAVPAESVALVPAADYYRSTGLKAAVGGTLPRERTLMFAYLTVSYFLKNDGAGNRILYRATSAGTQSLAWPFAGNAAFNYRLDNNTTGSTISSANVARIRAVQMNLPPVRLRRGAAAGDTMNVQPWLTLYNAR